MGLFKKTDRRPEVTPDEIAEQIVKVLSSKNAQDELAKAIEKYPENEKQKVEFELKMLKVIGKSFAIRQAFEGTPEGKAIWKSFVKLLISESPNIFNMTPGEISSILTDRMREYQEAWETPHPSGPFFMIGKVYAEHIGYPESARVTFKGSIWFGGELNFTIPALKKIMTEYRIKLPDE